MESFLVERMMLVFSESSTIRSQRAMMTSGISNGLVIKSEAPRRMLLTSADFSDVITMTGIRRSASSSFRFSRKVKPSMTGMIRSSRISEKP